VLLDRELVVEGVDRGDPQRGGGEREVVGAVRDREVEAPAGEPAHLPRPAGQRLRLVRTRSPAVAPHGDVVDPHPLEQRDRLRVVARGDLHLVSGLAEEADDRAEDDRVRGRRHVDPDPQGS
jgi:hypothetical protein